MQYNNSRTPAPKTEAKKAPAILESKKKAQILWKVLFFCMTLTSAVLLQKVYLYHTTNMFEVPPKGHLIDFLWGILAAVIFHYLENKGHQLLNGWVMTNYIREDRYTDPEARARRVHTLARWIYSIWYYFTSAVVAYFLIRDTSGFPTWLGGSGQCLNNFVNIPNMVEQTLAMKVFYLVSFGKHFNHFVTHTFIKPQGNYYQYVLHHGVSTFLILFSYLTNLWQIGIMILMIHDWSDCWLAIARLYTDYKHRIKKVQQIIYIFTFVFWISCRIIVHNACCLYPILEAYNIRVQQLNADQIFIIRAPGLFMGILVYVLSVLNFFWTFYIVKAFIFVNITEKVKSTYD